MAPEPRESTQRTPEGAEIPVPKRADFMRDMEKVAAPAKPPERDDDSRADDSPKQTLSRLLFSDCRGEARG